MRILATNTETQIVTGAGPNDDDDEINDGGF